ncbi:hypothetical protein ACOMHN_007155 [Nucella lapillus]
MQPVIRTERSLRLDEGDASGRIVLPVFIQSDPPSKESTFREVTFTSEAEWFPGKVTVMVTPDGWSVDGSSVHCSVTGVHCSITGVLHSVTGVLPMVSSNKRVG